jgi:hypothetical protein
MKTYFKFMTSIGLSLIFTGCMTNSKEMILENAQQLEVRSYQVKTYQESKATTSRAVVSALQDLGFILDRADMETGTVTATKLDKHAAMKITIIVREKIQKQTTVRINAQFSSGGSMPTAVDDPETYGSFFSTLDKAIFLDKQGL